MTSYKVSVIIPIYNVSIYIQDCVLSVLNQSYENVEIILVDDGSSDESGQLCDELAKRDSKIIVVHKENGGLSDARNTGIRVATGDYILFLDGDDFWDDSEALLRLVQRVTKTNGDVINYSYKKYFDSDGRKIPYIREKKEMPLGLLTKEERIKDLIDRDLYIASACNKMIKKSLFMKNDLFFRKNIYSEDIEWCARLLVCSEKMDFVDENFYCYRQRENSITHTISEKKCVDLCNNILDCINLADMVDPKIRPLFLRYVAYQYGTFVKVQAQAEKVPYDQIEKLRKHSSILGYGKKNKKIFILYCLTKIFGYKGMCRLFRFIY